MRSLAAGFLLGVAGSAQANVLVILADDLGVDSIACYREGSDLPNTPNLDALATRGVLFRHAYAYPSCSPTRAALLTGRHPSRTLVGRWIRHENNTGPAVGTLRAGEHTLPELLDRANSGRAHACIGKWHLHDMTFGSTAPAASGFGHYTGFLAGQLPSYFAWPRVANGIETTSTVYATTQQTDDALAWITTQTRPWLCYLAFNAPHLPMQAPPPHLHTRTLGPTPSNRQLYLAMIEALDTEIGRLLTTLGPTVVANTHVLFLGDNGSIQNMAVPPFLGGRAKGTPYEGGINVPLLYAGPAVTAPGREVTALACAVDVFATALELCHATSALPAWHATDGISLLPYLTDPAAMPRRTFAFSEEFTGNAWPAPNTNGHATVRDGAFKLIHRYGGGSHELFDLQADPFERTNLLAGTLSPMQQQHYQALLGEVSRLRTPIARCVPFGSPTCVGSRGVPVLACSAVPRLGSTPRLLLGNAASGTVAVRALGFSHTAQGSAPLPRDLSPWGPAIGCTQWFSLDATDLAITDAAGSASLPIGIPNVPALVETVVFGGWWILDATAPANPAGLVNTTALALVVGP
ncbi:MAG: sulfatase-like hydrolase/transferase [Planctomycetes bacterium]|nr:sulfatase-like hydrolase/transferase [Planctomycetota bacterium]